MPRIYVDFTKLDRIGSRCKSIASKTNVIQSDFQNTIRQLDWDVRFESNINSTATQIARKLDLYSRALENYHRFIEDVLFQYSKLDNYKKKDFIAQLGHKNHPINNSNEKLQIFIDEFRSNYGWNEILSEAGYISKINGIINDIQNAKTWQDLNETYENIQQFFSDASKTYNNYTKIGNAVGTKKAMTWWAKKVLGLNPIGRTSQAKKPITRFLNNLTNKSSPFNLEHEELKKNITGANGVNKAISTWGGIIFNGAQNLSNNMDEQANSNGTMSGVRVAAETFTETIIDTAFAYGTSNVVGAAVAAAFGSVAAPGIIVGAASTAIVAGVNAGVKALTGKPTTEWISDTILDTGKAIGSTAKNVSGSVGNWFRKLSIT